MHSIFKILTGLLAASQVATALPQPITGSSVRSIEKRDADITKEVAGHEGLYVPMMYAGYLDAASGKYDRYQCDNDGEKKADHKDGDLDEDKRAIVTDGLASCVSVSLITAKGTLKTHIPPYLCPVIAGTDKDEGRQKQLKKLEDSISTLYKAHKDDLKDGKMIAVSGSYSQEDQVRQLIKNFFSDKLGFIAFKLDIPLDPTNDHRTTVVDYTSGAPKFYIEGNEIPVGL